MTSQVVMWLWRGSGSLKLERLCISYASVGVRHNKGVYSTGHDAEDPAHSLQVLEFRFVRK